jgi:hypothetical protein
MQLQEGQRIKAPFLSDVAEVIRFEPRTGYALLQEDFFFFIEAKRIRLAYQFDPIWRSASRRSIRCPTRSKRCTIPHWDRRACVF